RSSAERAEAVDVQRNALAVQRNDQAKPDDNLGGCDGHHGQREYLPVAVVQVASEGDEGEVSSVEHDLEREQDDERVAADQHAERAHAEQEAGDGQIPRSARSHHSDGTSSAVVRECAPRMTPPIAATSSTIEVISKASRWSVRKRRPM